MCAAAAIRSCTSAEKPVSSPSLSPSPVKSKRSTATPSPASAWLIRTAAFEVLSQVKQWAKSAKACAVPSGRSSRAASLWPRPLVKAIDLGLHGGSPAWPAQHSRDGTRLTGWKRGA